MAMITIGISILLFSLLLIGLSSWKLDKLIMACLFIGFVCIEIAYYGKHGYWNTSGVIGDMAVVSFFFYLINIHKIMKTKILQPIKPNEFKDYLERNGIFSGYNKFIYNFPIVILLLMFIYCIFYYSTN